MSKQTEIVPQLLAYLGGQQNISNVFHCMTRLRFNLKDVGLAKIDEIKKLDGVLGVQNACGEIQVIIGAGVESFYNEVIKVTGQEANAAINENLDPTLSEKQPRGVKRFFSGILKAISACLSPLIPLFIVIGVFNMIAVLIGPMFLKLVTEESSLYRNFYFVGQSILYFLPVLLAYSSARYFGANPLVTIAVASMLVFPDFVALVGAEGAAYTMFGIPVPSVAYNGSVFPVILIAWIQSYIEKWLNKVIPDIIKVIIIPCGTILILLPIAFCLVGPAGYYLGIGIGKLLYMLYSVAGPLATALLGAFGVLGLAAKVLTPVFFMAMSSLFANGVEYLILPNSMVYINWVVMGAMIGYFIKTKGAKNKQFALTCFASNFLGGVSEPSIFGVILNNRSTIIATIIAGGLAGLYSGIMHVGYYSFGPSNFLGVIGFMGGGSMNFLHACIASGIAFFGAMIATIILYKETPTVNTMKEGK